MKTLYKNISLEVSLQGPQELTENEVAAGLLDRTEEGFRFKECSLRKRYMPLPRVYDGRLVSMVCHRTGKHYQLYLKQVLVGENTKDLDVLAESIAQEVLEAVARIGV